MSEPDYEGAIFIKVEIPPSVIEDYDPDGFEDVLEMVIASAEYELLKLVNAFKEART